MTSVRLTALSVSLAFAFGSAAAVAAEGMSKADYKAGKEKIEAEYKTAHSACSSQAGNAKDICVAEAKGREKVARAELEERHEPGSRSERRVAIAKAEAAHAIAREKCDDKADDAKKNCLKDAKEEETRAKTAARAPMKVAAATEAKGAPAGKTGAESPGEYVDDAVITTKVKAAVLQETTLKSAEINVETLRGTVQLTGFVRSRADINKAVEITKAVKGVKSVKNDMILKGTQ